MKKGLLFSIDMLLFAAVFVLFNFVRPDILLIGFYLVLFIYLRLTDRKKEWYYLCVSSLVAFVWMFFANGQYGYNSDMLKILGYHVFPLFGWAVALFGAYLLYSFFENRLPGAPLYKRIFVAFIVFGVILLLVETVAYHLFDIKNLATAAYAGLPICNCMHAPTWMQVSYFSLGPIYIMLCEMFGLYKLKRHHKK